MPALHGVTLSYLKLATAPLHPSMSVSFSPWNQEIAHLYFLSSCSLHSYNGLILHANGASWQDAIPNFQETPLLSIINSAGSRTRRTCVSYSDNSEWSILLPDLALPSAAPRAASTFFPQTLSSVEHTVPSLVRFSFPVLTMSHFNRRTGF